MKITKYSHACILVEADNGQNALFDPGNYSYESASFNISQLPELNYLLITHEHADHFHMPFVVEICQKYPDIKIITNSSVAKLLEGSVRVSIGSKSDENCEVFTAPHENLPFGQPPDNIGFHFNNSLTHPGDSHSFVLSKQVLAMPMTAPWGSMTAATKKIISLKPKVVVPIHDWHWRPEALAKFYSFLSGEFNKAGIDFKIPIDGQPIEI